eukprot:GHVH01000220.1.p1 GENE.GHVH01000220.1~~GHVH01000220.1.p1  ORF type:complete len:165 (+),score=33.64 GHVH01000220.1:174-668(+)
MFLRMPVLAFRLFIVGQARLNEPVSASNVDVCSDARDCDNCLAAGDHCRWQHVDGGICSDDMCLVQDVACFGGFDGPQNSRVECAISTAPKYSYGLPPWFFTNNPFLGSDNSDRGMMVDLPTAEVDDNQTVTAEVDDNQTVTAEVDDIGDKASDVQFIQKPTWF